MEDLNKISSTKVGDSISFYLNNKQDNGTVVKMEHSFITVLKDNGDLQHIHINDTFFVKDILLNKTWDDMNENERFDMLTKVHAPTPRYLSKSWKQLPKELQETLLKSSPEGGKVSGSNTGAKVPSGGGEEVKDAEEDYEGIHIEEDKEQFKHDEVKPTTKNNAMESSHKEDEKKEEWDGKFSSKEAPELTEGVKKVNDEAKAKVKVLDNIYRSSWETWLEKEGGMGDGGSPATTKGRDSGYETFNTVYSKVGRHGGQTKDKEEDEMQEK